MIRQPHPKYSKFRFDAGSLALNFVATVRHRGTSKPRDLLSAPDKLAEWFRLAGCSNPAPAPSVKDLERAVHLREAIYRTVRALVLNENPCGTDICLINQAAGHTLPVPQLDADFAVHWKSAHPVRACLAEIATDAAMMLVNVERQRFKMCGNGGCQMLFLDNSPANRRRWCSMSVCGNREKIRSFRQRLKSI